MEQHWGSFVIPKPLHGVLRFCLTFSRASHFIHSLIIHYFTPIRLLNVQATAAVDVGSAMLCRGDTPKHLSAALVGKAYVMSHRHLRARLEEGNAQFRQRLQSDVQRLLLQRQLALGQSPRFVVLSCMDSRVPVEEIFSLQPGEAFVLRNAGHVLSDAIVASLEFAVVQLHVRYILVMGHSNCGAVQGAIRTSTATGESALPLLLRRIRNSLEEPLSKWDTVDERALEYLIKYHSLQTARAIPTLSRAIDELCEKGYLKIQPAYYHIDSGTVEFYDHLPQLDES